MLAVMLTGLFFALIAGLCQGMIMFQPNLRDHVWFPFYHRFVRFVEPLSCGLFFIELNAYGLWQLQNLAFFPGLFITGWELFEVGYSYTKYWKLIPEEENVFGLGWRLKGSDVQVAHGLRTAIGVVLLSLAGAI